MSATNISVIPRQTMPPAPVRLPIGPVNFSDVPDWAIWFDRVAKAFTDYIILATIDFGNIAANSFKTELVTTNHNFGDPQNAFVVPLLPSSVGGLPLGGRLVLTNRLQAIIYNQTAAVVTPGALDLQFLVLERR